MPGAGAGARAGRGWRPRHVPGAGRTAGASGRGAGAGCAARPALGEAWRGVAGRLPAGRDGAGRDGDFRGREGGRPGAGGAGGVRRWRWRWRRAGRGCGAQVASALPPSASRAGRAQPGPGRARRPRLSRAGERWPGGAAQGAGGGRKERVRVGVRVPPPRLAGRGRAAQLCGTGCPSALRALGAASGCFLAAAAEPTGERVRKRQRQSLLTKSVG